MESPKGNDEEASQPFDSTLVPAETNVDKQPNSADNYDFDQVDPISSQGVTSLDDKKQVEAEEQRMEKENKDPIQTIKTTIIVSGVILAVAGAIFAITKKLREK